MSNTGTVPILFCTKCGSSTPANAQFCNNCGTPLPVASSMAVAPVYAYKYAGFWIRFVAFFIDAIIVGVVCAPFAMFSMRRFVTEMMNSGNRGPDPETIVAFMSGMFMLKIFTVAIGWIYEAWMTSSERQATVGKIAVGLKVTDLNGQRISFARATGRHFAKILSAMILLIGYIMVAFMPRKQGLHDLLANTIVVKS